MSVGAKYKRIKRLYEPRSRSPDAYLSRVVYSKSQKNILLRWFECNPYLNRDAKEQLAKEIGVPASKIEIWFKNERQRRRKSESKCTLREDLIQGHAPSQLSTQEKEEARQNQILLTKAQRRIPVQAFKRNQVPDTTTLKKPAKQKGLQKWRIQMWCQDQRVLCPEWSKIEPTNFLVGDTNGKPDLIDQLQETDLSILPDGGHHLPSFETFWDNQTISPSLLLSRVSLIPWESFKIRVSQEPRSVHPTQAVQGGENSDPGLTCIDHLPELPIPGGDFSGTPVLFWTQFQEECQKHKEQTGLRVTSLKDNSQPPPELEESQDLGHVDISYIMHWWDDGRHALIAEWGTSEEMH